MGESEVLIGGGVELTFAIVLAASSKSECQFQNSTEPHGCRWSFDSNIRKSASEMECECWNRTTGPDYPYDLLPISKRERNPAAPANPLRLMSALFLLGRWCISS
jgi:hypothetical protein